MARMMGRNLKQSRISYTPFSNCFCCDGPTPKGRAAEKRDWLRDLDEVAAEFGVDLTEDEE